MYEFMLKFFVVAAMMAAADWCWTIYFIKTAEKKAAQAAAWSSLIIAISAFTVTSYVENHWFILAAVIGAFVGTYYAVKYGHTTKPS